MDLSLSLIMIIGGVFLIAGFVKGVIGLGLPTISIGLLSLVMSPAQAAVLLIIPSTITNMQQMRPASSLWSLCRRLWPMMVGIIVGTWAGGGVINGANAKFAAAALGAALVIYGGLGLAQIQFRVERRHESWLSPLVGAITGVITAATGIFVIPAVPYLQAVGFEKNELVQALGLSFFLSTLALAVTLGSTGLAEGAPAWAAVGTLIPALAGQMIGTTVRETIDAATFKRWFFTGLIGLGSVLIAKPLFG